MKFIDYKKVQPISHLVNEFIKEQGWNERVAAVRVIQVWSEIAGNIAEQVKVRKLENGLLTVKASSAIWKTEIRLRADELVKKINEKLGEDIVKEMKIL